MEADAEGSIVTFILTDDDGVVDRDDIPDNVTHLIIHESVTHVSDYLFALHPNIIDVYCHAGVMVIGERSFACCRSLKRVTMLGVEFLDNEAFRGCESLEFVQCEKLRMVGDCAFYNCKSLPSINLPSVEEMFELTFASCAAMTHAKLGPNLKPLDWRQFYQCSSLERITLPLKVCIACKHVFQCCDNLKSVETIEESVLQETIASLQLEKWRDDMKEEYDSIKLILPNAPAGVAGRYSEEDPTKYIHGDFGEKATEIDKWIERILGKVKHYKSQHRQLVMGAASVLKKRVPQDIVLNHVIPFLELPSHVFEGED